MSVDSPPSTHPHDAGGSVSKTEGAHRRLRAPRSRRTRRILGIGSIFAAVTVAALTVAVLPASAATTNGIDVSHFQGTINWTSVHNAGTQFAYMKATEGTTFKDPSFN